MPVDARPGFLALRLPIASFTGGNDFATLTLKQGGQITPEAKALYQILEHIDGQHDDWHAARLDHARRHAAEHPEQVDDHSDADPGL